MFRSSGYLLLLFIFIVEIGCKKSSSTNNYINRDTLSAYTVEGIGDMVLSTDSQSATRYITIKYTDSVQTQVHLSLTGLPAGITVGSDFDTVGYPTFYPRLKLYDTMLLQPATVGDYPINFNVTSASGQVKSYPFTLHIKLPDDTCVNTYTGIFPNCDNGITTYADTVTLDAAIPNKVWFSNFNGEGLRVAGMVNNCLVSIPTQISAGKLISGGGKNISGYRLRLNVKIGNSFYILGMN